jgi:hypothetical protein
MTKIASKTLLLTAAASLGIAAAATAQAGSPYLAGDMHNHNTCTDGSVSIGYAIDRSVGTGTSGSGGSNFDLDWFTLGNHGGSGNRDCRFSDPSYNAKNPMPASETGTLTNPTTGALRATLWTDTLGQTIQGTTVAKLLGTQPATGASNMWRWQNIQQVEYPILTARGAQYGRKVLVEGLEWIVPGHEHTDVAILAGQATRVGAGNADAMAEFEYRFDRSDRDVIGPLNASNVQVWPGKDDASNLCSTPVGAQPGGTVAHAKGVAAIAWLQSNFALSSYAVPTHTERHGAFDPLTCNGGYNIEHFRDFNNAGPTVAFGIEAPGHAAQGTLTGGAGSYEGNAVGGGTYGFSGVYTAKVGGLWDGMLGEGRNFFIFASSDWHNRGMFSALDAATTGDFIPGEYTKLYVPNADGFNPQSIINGMRKGRSYSVQGNLIGSDMVFRAKTATSGWKQMGGTLVVNPGDKVTVEMSMTVPASNNSPYSFNNPLLAQVGIQQPLNKPSLDHVDLITGNITGVLKPTDAGYAVPNAGGLAGAAIVYNPSTVIAQQIPASGMKSKLNADGSTRYTFQTSFTAGSTPFYIRSRGTNIPVGTPNVTDTAGNPLIDYTNANVVCSDPACPAHMEVDAAGVKRVTHDVQAYSNLWFYANPIFVRPAGTPKLLVEVNRALAAKLGDTSGD